MTASSPTGLTLILGPANSGKLGRVLDWWQSRLAARPLIVVPTGPDARTLSVEMAQRAGALVGQSPAVTFDGLLRLLMGRTPRYPGDFERSLLISLLLQERPPRASGFSPRFPGTVGVAASLVEQLADSGRSAEELAQALDRWGSTDPASAILAADVRELLGGYRRLRDTMGLSDRADSIHEALSLTPQWTRPLAFYGFTSFTLAQRRLIRALGESAELLLVLDYERSRGLRGASLTTPDELAWWESLAVGTIELDPLDLAYTSPAVAYLERHFMDDGPLPEPPPSREADSGVRFLLASGRRNEAELAAEMIAGLLRSGLRPGQIAVVVRNMKMWGRLLGEVFASCGIPCQVDERLTLDETGIGHAFVTALWGVAEDDPDAVLLYLRSPFSSLTLEAVADLERDYLRRTARGVEALQDRAGPEARTALSELRLVVRRQGEGTVVDLQAAEGLAGRMLENAFRGASPGAFAAPDLAADARAFRALQGALARLSAQHEAGALPAGALRPAVLLSSLAGMTVPGGALGPEDAVQVLTAHRARARRFEAVFVLGLAEGEFPSRSERPALLTDAQRDRLDAAGGGLFSPEADEEEALFVRAISRAWSHLFLSSRDADDGGGYEGQSYYWLHCKSLLGAGEHDHVHRSLADQVFEPEGAPTLRQYLRACVARDLRPHPGCGCESLPTPLWHGEAVRAHLVSDVVIGELAATPSFSPSALESYLACPFKWFLEKVVGIEDLETVVDNRLLGQYLHTVLSETYQELRAADALPLISDGLVLAQSLAASAIEALVDGEECPGTPAQRRLVKYQLKSLTTAVFAMEVAAADTRRLEATELTVGGREGVDVGGLVLRGRIDRVDSDGSGGLFVIDYKSGSIPEKRKIGTAEGLQLPLYILALGAERPEQRVTGGVYVSPRKRERAGVLLRGCAGASEADAKACRVFEDEEMEQMLQAALALAREAADGITSGSIAPRADRKCPDWCKLGPACRRRRARARYGR